MPPKQTRLNALDSHKRLLIAESEINRAHMLEEWQVISDEFRGISDRVQSMSSIASIFALLLGGVSAFRTTKSLLIGAKPSWFQTAVKGVQMARGLWLNYRARHGSV